MYSIGIDADKRTLVIHVVDEGGEPVHRARVSCEAVGEFRALLRNWTPCQTVVEACNLADWIGDICREEGTRFVLAHPSKVKLIAQTVKKTDRVDAKILAELLARNYIPEAYAPTREERQDRSLVRTHAYLAKEKRRAKIRVRAVLNRHNLCYEKGEKSLFTQAGRQWLRELKLGGGEELEVRTALGILEASEAQSKTTDREIAKRGRANPAARRLQTLPGVGALTALTLVATLGDWTRFGSTRKAVAFLGLCPTVSQSGKRCHLGHITRAGDGFARGLLVEAAWRLIRRCPRYREEFEQLAKRRGRKIAIVAIARKLLQIAVAMLRDGTDFEERERPTIQAVA